MKKMLNRDVVLWVLNGVIYSTALFLFWSVGGWKLLSAALLFGWGMNLENRIKAQRPE